MSVFRLVPRGLFAALLACTSLVAALAYTPTASAQKLFVNEFYRGGNLATTDEWVEVVLTEALTAAELEGFFVGDSTGTRAAKFSGYRFTNMSSIASNFPAGTIIVVTGATGPASDLSYNPASGDWNITLRTGDSNITGNGSTGDLAGDDVVYVDTNGTNGNATISADGFAITWRTPAAGALGLASNVAVAAPANNTGAVLSTGLAGATTPSNWTLSVAAASLTPGEPNGGDNTDYILALRNPPAQPTLAIGNVSENEGDAGTTSFVFNVTLSNVAGGAVSVDFATQDGSATVADGDYQASSGTLSFDGTEGEIRTITVLVNGDTTPETDETFSVLLSNPSPGTVLLNPATGTGTILNDDAAPILISIADASLVEGNSGDAPMLFTVSIDAPAPAGGVSVDFVTADGTATAGSDYVATSGTASIAEGDTSTTITVAIIGDELGEFDETFSVTLSNPTGAALNDASATGTILNDDRWFVWQVQGSGPCSPVIVPCVLNANTAFVTLPVRAAIVTAIGPDGFAMQTPDAESDNDPTTSDGIWVFTFAGAAPQTDSGETIAVGDRLEVTGGVKEFFGFTEVQVNTTRNSSNSIVRLAQGQPLPTAVEFSLTAGVPSTDPDALSCPGSGLGGAAGNDTNFECFESMRVVIPDGVVSAPNQRFGTDLFAEVYASPIGQRGVREKGALFGVPLSASNAAAGSWDGNPEIIELDADYLIPANAGLELNGGARFSAEGVIGFDFGDYEIWPTVLNVVPGTNELVNPVPASSPDELTIGSFNAFRLCDDIDDRGTGGIQFLCAATAALETDSNRLIHERGQISAYVRQVLRSPDVIGFQEVEKLGILAALATQIADDGGPTYEAFLVEGNDPGGIDVGYLVNTARVGNISVTQLAANETWDDPVDGPGTLLHDRPPLLLTADFIGNGRPFRFQLINNHTRSRGGVETGDAASNRVRAKRFLQGVSIATLAQDLQTATATASIPLLVIGDLNAYQFTDAFADVVGLIAGTYDNAANTCAPTNGVTNCELPGGVNIVDPPLTNAVLLLDEDEQYSYNFTENFGPIQGHTPPTAGSPPNQGRDIAVNQVLDHALFNEVARPFVTGMAYGRANVDAPVQRFRTCNYRFRDAAVCPQGPGTWVPTGSSDHDGLVIFLAPPRPDEIFANGFED